MPAEMTKRRAMQIVIKKTAEAIVNCYHQPERSDALAAIERLWPEAHRREITERDWGAMGLWNHDHS